MINVSGKISRHELDVYRSIHQAVSQLGIAFLVVGASARDLVLHHAHDTPIVRATGDIDIAIQVRTWHDFTALKSALVKGGFIESDQVQRLISPSGLPVDIMPFGDIEDGKGKIQWMPEGAIEMSVLGFKEALDHADIVRVSAEPTLDIPVATLAGLSILKVMAWTDRSADQREKDAADFLYLLKHCERSHPFDELVFSDANIDILESYDWDTTLATANLLGVAARNTMSDESVVFFSAFLAGEMTPLGIERLIEEMTPFDENYERNKALTHAYFSGISAVEK